MLILSDQDIAGLLTMSEAIEAVEGAFAQLRRRKVVMPTRSTIMIPKYNGSISFMPCYLEETGAQAIKIISIYPDNQRRGLPTTAAWIVVNDPETGQIKAFMDGTYLTGVRTGAVSGVAAKYLAPNDAKIATVFGAGVQARNQVWAAATVRKLEEIRVYDPIKPAVDRFAEDMEKRLAYTDMSLDHPLYDEGEETLMDVMQSDENIEDAVTAREKRNILELKVKEFKTMLNDKELLIFEKRIMAEEPMTLQEIGARFKISRERVRQIENRVLKKFNETFQADLRSLDL
jgi:RNA polymerase sigma factor (sigma-70 family)